MSQMTTLLQMQFETEAEVLILGFGRSPQKAKIIELHDDYAEVGFLNDGFDESDFLGKYTIPFTQIVCQL